MSRYVKLLNIVLEMTLFGRRLDDPDIRSRFSKLKLDRNLSRVGTTLQRYVAEAEASARGVPRATIQYRDGSFTIELKTIAKAMVYLDLKQA